MDLELQRISDIAVEPVQMLTAPYIALGKIAILQGDPQTGKTHIALAIAAALTTGTPMPWEEVPYGVCDIIFQSMEDGYADTIRPRLEMLGADCDRVHVINEEKRPLTLTDGRLEQAIARANAKLLIIDPLSAYMGTELCGGGVRSIMTQFALMLGRTNCAALLISHLNKKGGKSQYRGLGSIDITAIARSVLTVGKLPFDEDMRAFVHSKSNLAPNGDSQAFGFDDVSSFTWLGSCEISVDELLEGKQVKPADTETALDAAMSFLREELKNGALPSTQVIRDANAAGISERTLKRAKQSLGVRSVKISGGWLWSIPDFDVVDVTDYEQHTPMETQPCQTQSLALLNVT
jgi:hypothetical protein